MATEPLADLAFSLSILCARAATARFRASLGEASVAAGVKLRERSDAGRSWRSRKTVRRTACDILNHTHPYGTPSGYVDTLKAAIIWLAIGCCYERKREKERETTNASNGGRLAT